MKPPPVEYRRASSLEEAVALLTEYGDDAKVIAGGQSLIPLLNFRLARPRILVDIGSLREMASIRRDGQLSIGALVTHHEVELSAGRPSFNGFEVLPSTAPLIGHLPIRTRGTFGGSVAHGDPSAEWPLLCTALDATLLIAHAEGIRRESIDDFYLGFLSTSLAPTEVLVEIEFVRPPRGAAVAEYARRRGDFAVVSVAVAMDWTDDRVCTAARVAAGGVDSVPVRLPDAESVLVGAPVTLESIDEAAAVAAACVTPSSDLHATAQYRRHLVRELTRKALTRATSSTSGGS